MTKRKQIVSYVFAILYGMLILYISFTTIVPPVKAALLTILCSMLYTRGMNVGAGKLVERIKAGSEEDLRAIEQEYPDTP